MYGGALRYHPKIISADRWISTSRLFITDSAERTNDQNESTHKDSNRGRPIFNRKSAQIEAEIAQNK